MLKRIFFVLGGVLAVFILVLVIFPEVRQAILGVRLVKDVPAGRLEPVSVVSMLMCAREMRGYSGEINFNMDDDVQPDVYDYAANLVESVSQGGNEPIVNYEIKEEKFAQVGANKPNLMVKNLYSLRLQPSGVLAGLELLRGRHSKLYDGVRMAQLLSPLWLAKPNKRVYLGQVWDGNYKLDYSLATLGKSEITLDHRLKYKLEEITSDNGMDLAKISYNGSIVVSPKEDCGPNIKIAGQGHIEGVAMLNLRSGSVVLADDRTAWGLVVRFIDKEVEDVNLFDRKSRIFRPLYVRNAGENFSSAMPSEGEGMADIHQMDKKKDGAKR
ncbi:hypothetical protein IJT10_06830 [bacterium]|nr:hypothetical protein [bacterium]